MYFREIDKNIIGTAKKYNKGKLYCKIITKKELRGYFVSSHAV